MEHLQSLRSFYIQQQNTKQKTKAMIITPHTEAIIIIGRKSLLGGTWLSLCLFIDCAWLAAEKAAKEKNDTMRNLEKDYSVFFSPNLNSKNVVCCRIITLPMYPNRKLINELL